MNRHGSMIGMVSKGRPVLTYRRATGAQTTEQSRQVWTGKCQRQASQSADSRARSKAPTVSTSASGHNHRNGS